MPTMSPEILEFLKFFLAAPNRFDAGQQTTNVQNTPGLTGGEQQGGDAFQALLKNFNLGSTTDQPSFAKFGFFS